MYGRKAHHAPVIYWHESIQRRKLITRKQKLNQYRGVNTTTTYFIRTLRGGRNG
jgi:hypothetical protein